jgi:hypothetical protein
MINDKKNLCNDQFFFVVASLAIEKFQSLQAWQPIIFYHCKVYGG